MRTSIDPLYGCRLEKTTSYIVPKESMRRTNAFVSGLLGHALIPRSDLLFVRNNGIPIDSQDPEVRRIISALNKERRIFD